MARNWALALVGFLVVAAALVAAWGEWRKQAQPELVIEWTTESQVDTAGFFLYRSESPGGPWAQANAELIPATDVVLTGAQYTFVDTGVQAGHTYYYELEDVEFSGRRARHAIGSGTPPPARAWVLGLSGAGVVIGLYLVVGGLGLQPRRARERIAA